MVRTSVVDVLHSSGDIVMLDQVPTSRVADMDTRSIGRQTVPARDFPVVRPRGGWRAANLVRRRQGHRIAMRMLALKVSGYRGQAIATVFGTTRTAVYMRLSRLRRGYYSSPTPHA